MDNNNKDRVSNGRNLKHLAHNNLRTHLRMQASWNSELPAVLWSIFPDCRPPSMLLPEPYLLFGTTDMQLQDH